MKQPRDIRLHGHDHFLHIFYGHIHRYRRNIDGQYHIPGEVHQLSHQLIFDKVCIFPQEEDAAHLIP